MVLVWMEDLISDSVIMCGITPPAGHTLSVLQRWPFNDPRPPLSTGTPHPFVPACLPCSLVSTPSTAVYSINLDLKSLSFTLFQSWRANFLPIFIMCSVGSCSFYLVNLFLLVPLLSPDCPQPPAPSVCKDSPTTLQLYIKSCWISLHKSYFLHLY